MMIGRPDDPANPVVLTGNLSRVRVLGLDRGTHQGQRHAPHQQAGHMTAIRTLVASLATKPLALRGRPHMARRPRKVAAIALANKMARIAWSMMTSGEAYRRQPLVA